MANNNNLKLAFDIGTGLASLVISGVLEYQRAKNTATNTSDEQFNKKVSEFFDNAINTWNRMREPEQLELSFNKEEKD